jgi:uncharacterized membrane protein
MAERRSTLLVNNLLTVALCFSYAWVLRQVPSVEAFEPTLFLSVGAIMLGLSLALWRHWIGYLPAASLSLGVATLLLAERLLMVNSVEKLPSVLNLVSRLDVLRRRCNQGVRWHDGTAIERPSAVLLYLRSR